MTVAACLVRHGKRVCEVSIDEPIACPDQVRIRRGRPCWMGSLLTPSVPELNYNDEDARVVWAFGIMPRASPGLEAPNADVAEPRADNRGVHMIFERQLIVPGALARTATPFPVSRAGSGAASRRIGLTPPWRAGQDAWCSSVTMI